MKTAIFPGSFDPFTIGHLSIVERALPFFEKIIIAIGDNYSKKPFFSIEERINNIKNIFADNPKIEIKSYTCLTVDFCKENNCSIIIRGLRNSFDFENERNIAEANKFLDNNIETFFMLALPEHSFISSSLVRDLLKHSKNVEKFLYNNKIK